MAVLDESLPQLVMTQDHKTEQILLIWVISMSCISQSSTVIISQLRGHKLKFLLQAGWMSLLPLNVGISTPELTRVSVRLCWHPAPLSHSCLGPRGALISQTNSSRAAALLAALIYLPDMCFLVCFLSPARRCRWYWAVLTALLHSCQMNQSLPRAPQLCLVPPESFPLQSMWGA